MLSSLLRTGAVPGTQPGLQHIPNSECQNFKLRSNITMSTNIIRFNLNCFLVFAICVLCISCAKSVVNNSLQNEDAIVVTSEIEDYANSVVKPLISHIPREDKLSIIQKISGILLSKEHGVNANAVEPSKYIHYDIFDTFKLGFLVTFNLSSQQKQNIKNWHAKYMSDKAADVFFAPTANEIIKDRAAFGCTHYARAFIAIIKSLELIDNPLDLRYVVACVAKDYNKAYKKQDYEMTINGHQFVMVRISSKWYAINTSKGETIEMAKDFSPDKISPPNNTPIQFPSYPEITFLFRKIGKDYSDNIQDNSFIKLMNIYRSGENNHQSFSWNEYEKI